MINSDYLAAKAILRGTNLGIIDAARLIVEAVELCGGGIDRIRKGLQLAARELKKNEKTVPFERAVEETLAAKAHRRPRTLRDIRLLCARLMKHNPCFASRPLRSLSADDCRQAIDRAFSTPRQRFKIRAVLSGVFSIGRKRGWCSENPVECIDVPVLHEKEIKALSLPEIRKLFSASQSLDGGKANAALSLMLYAGIRPGEITRLRWCDICLQEQVVSLRARHSKTGGTRHVTILPALKERLLACYQQLRPEPDTPVCPKNWETKWQRIRLRAGWAPGHWQQDCLRHTYASYHAKLFKNYELLQMEMGHRSAHLLRTRYINMSNVTLTSARAFWRIPPRQTGT